MITTTTRTAPLEFVVIDTPCPIPSLPTAMRDSLRAVYAEGLDRGVRDVYQHGFDHFVGQILQDFLHPWPLEDEAT